MFFDEVALEVSGGHGGNGAVSFHREKFVAHGPPDGGDAGRGGSVIFKANENINTFRHFSGRKSFKADPGGNGHKNNRHGRNGEDLVLEVPVGTLIYSGEELLVDLSKHGMHYIAAAGGRGGYGNAHFVSSTRQAPDFAELGDRGEHLEVRLEIQLLADIGLVGFPSAGKSTLISHVSAAKPKIGDYPFTTLVPNLGVVKLSDFGGGQEQTFVIADMPGIIEGAAEGKGLGDRFLKHISRSAGLLFLLDPFSYDDRSMTEQYSTLRSELEKYNPELLKKDYFVVMNKIDAIPHEDREELRKEFNEEHPDEKLWMVSGVSGENLSELLFELWNGIQARKEETPQSEETDDVPLYIPGALVDEHAFEITKLYDVESEKFEKPILNQQISNKSKSERGLYSVKGLRIEQISRMTNTDQRGGIQRVYDVMKKMGIEDALRGAGAVTGDLVKIGPHFYEYHDL